MNKLVLHNKLLSFITIIMQEDIDSKIKLVFTDQGHLNTVKYTQVNHTNKTLNIGDVS